MASLDDYSQDLEELRHLRSIAKRPRILSLISAEIASVENKVLSLPSSGNLSLLISFLCLRYRSPSSSSTFAYRLVIVVVPKAEAPDGLPTADLRLRTVF